MDPISLGAGIVGLNNLGTLVKNITGALKESGKAEVISQVIDLQMLVSELIEKNRQLSNENQALHAQLELREKMAFRNPFYYMANDPHPFCPQCWDADNKAVRLSGGTFVEQWRAYSWDCKTCESHFTTTRNHPTTA